MKPQITFVNHASYILSLGELRIICDPWLEGRSFDQSWALLSKSVFGPKDFAGITHIWFSHEHPDHFSPPNLLSIPAEVRAGIHVIYRHTEDHKVRDWCMKNGFGQVTELALHEWTQITPDVRVMCGPCADDSWLLLEGGGTRILNINDCMFESAQMAEVAKLAGQPIDVLFTQFSYASYVGDRNKPGLRHAAAKKKREEMMEQVQVFSPKAVVPFASYVWFCHEENFYLNDGINKVGDIAEHLRAAGVETVVLYPGDTWEAGSPHDNQNAVARYTADYGILQGEPPLTKTKNVPLEELQKKAESFCKSITKQHGFWGRFLYIRPQRIYLSDLKQTVALGLGGLKPLLNGSAEKADWEMSSGALSFCLSFPWGFNTLHVSGRFHTSSVFAYNSLCQFCNVADSVNHNHGTYPFVKMSVKNRLRNFGLAK